MPETPPAFERRLNAAASAAWRTLLVVLVLGGIGQGIMLAVFHLRPAWVLHAWGAEQLGWPYLRRVAVWIMAAFKLLWLAGGFVTLFLVLWARRLRATPGERT